MTASVINVNKVYKIVKQTFIVIIILKQLDCNKCSFSDNAPVLVKQHLEPLMLKKEASRVILFLVTHYETKYT